MNRRRALTSILGVGTTLVSGCLRLSAEEGEATPVGTTPSSKDGQSADAVRTTQNAVVDTSTPSYPMGLTDSGLEFPGSIFSGHVDMLQQTSFRARWTKFDRTHSQVKWQKEYRGESGRAYGTWTRQWGAPVEMYRYVRGDYWREDLGSRFTYGEEDSFNQGHVPEVWGIEINPLLEAVDWGPPSRINHSRPAMWELTSASVGQASAIPGYHNGSVTSVSSTSMRIDERGVIRRVNAVYSIQEEDGEEKTYETVFRIDSIGTISVTEPAWLSTARDRAPTASATLTDDNLFVKFNIDSGNPIEPNSWVWVGNNASKSGFGLQIEEPIGAGDTAYLYRPESFSDSTTDEAGMTLNRRPSNANPQELIGDYHMMARRKATHYFESFDVKT